MGKRKHSWHAESDSESDDSRSRSSDSSPDRSKKRSKKEKKEKHKKHKKKEHKDKDKERLLKEAKKFLKGKLKSGDPEAAAAAAAAAGGGGRGEEEAPVRAADVVPISKDDYYNRNAEFAVWLRDARRQYFSELSSEEAHALFDDFVASWNAGKLPAKFYSGTAARATQRTGFKWSFKGGAGRADQSSLGMAAALDDDINLREEERVAARDAAKDQRKRAAANEREWLDEVMPKATGREALVEKKLARREATKAREDSPELMRVTGGGDLMGGDDSFEAARAREARRTDWRSKQAAAKQEAVQARLAQAQAAEDEKLERFRALLAQGPLQIAKRQ